MFVRYKRKSNVGKRTESRFWTRTNCPTTDTEKTVWKGDPVVWRRVSGRNTVVNRPAQRPLVVTTPTEGSLTRTLITLETSSHRRRLLTPRVICTPLSVTSETLSVPQGKHIRKWQRASFMIINLSKRKTYYLKGKTKVLWMTSNKPFYSSDISSFDLTGP